MSRLWHDEIRIALTPRHAAAVKLKRGLTLRLAERKIVACPEAHGERAWAAPLEALRESLELPGIAGARAVVILSNHFVRYLLVPWNPEVFTPQEEIAFARACFGRVFGAHAEDWAITLADSAAGTARVASAVEQSLIDALAATLTHYSVRLDSVQPHLMSAFNAWPGRRSRDAWIAIAEPGGLLLGLRQGGAWHSLRLRPLEDPAIPLAEIIAQERKLLGMERGPERVFLHVADGASIDASGTRVERLLPFEPRNGSPRANDELSLALCGAV